MLQAEGNGLTSQWCARRSIYTLPEDKRMKSETKEKVAEREPAMTLSWNNSNLILFQVIRRKREI